MATVAGVRTPGVGARTAGRVTVVRFAVFGLLFVNGVLVSRGLGPEGRGALQLLVAVAAILVTTGGLSGELGYARTLVVRAESRRALWSTCLVAPLGLGGMVALLSAAAVETLHPGWLPVRASAELWLALAAVPFMIGLEWLQRALLIAGRLRLACVAPAVNAVVVLGNTTAWLALGQLSVTRCLAGFLAGPLVEYLLYVVALRARLSLFSLGLIRRVLRAGLAFHPSKLALAVTGRVDLLVLGSLRGVADAGVYAVAVSLASPLGLFASTVANSFMSTQYAGDRAQALLATRRLISGLAVAVAVVAVVLGGLSVVAIPVVWGPRFRGAVAPTLVLLAGAVPLAVQRPIGQFLVREGLARAAATRAVAGLAVAVVGCGLLVPPLGPLGAALGADLAGLTYTALSLVFFRRAIGCTWADLLARPLSLRTFRSRR